MVGLSVHGLMGMDTDLQRSAFAARQQQIGEYSSVHVVHRDRRLPPGTHRSTSRT